MRHFIAYHNAKRMGYSSTAITGPSVRTGNSVKNLEGVTVWLIAGEGESPKHYYLASKFEVEKCRPNAHPGEDLPHEVVGSGKLFKLSIPLDGGIVELLKKDSNNFRNGFYEVRNPKVVSELIARSR